MEEFQLVSKGSFKENIPDYTIKYCFIMGRIKDAYFEYVNNVLIQI